ncbi:MULTISPECIES: PIG-L family deacetylase [unclassified Thermoactinomyces]|uniref:PIG-L family deacetylase n=1 Tax=unclassified Thermoactinomyces TaxID=2634588 RepID=UPI0018DE31B8|nr:MULTISPECIES: PIG-L family deacetylase [unclassified Thermoactinomyces]MBH8596925.1 PIG-L family deacetylase [Thermoactinomyces sp. CICC 10523]MBH8603701.1 PIG-L family deacetylase [Thermoactinomyces sp. CICC 10522]MBH8607664.1 PIG-L family deacetylase [Thermoactinomyces sp. CICC 10521]
MKMSRKRVLIALLLVFVLLFPLASPSRSVAFSTASEPDQELWKALRPLDTIVNFMNTGAHPDDENSALLAYLSLGKGVRTISVLANRGEGGQNEIGPELGNALGIIRSRELQEAAKVLDVHLFMLSEDLNDPIYDFGFSKSPEETLKKWGETLTYERLIRRIRQERPDIIMPSFRDVPTEHGHHRAISELTVRAFKDAADPSVFPEQIKAGLKPWQVKKLYLPGTDGHETLRFNVGGKVDPVYGLTYPQLGEESRKKHKSQGMGRDLPVADQYISLELIRSSVSATGPETSLFDSLPYDFKSYASQVKDPALKTTLTHLQTQYERTQNAYPNRPEVTAAAVKALSMTRMAKELAAHAPLNHEQKDDLLYRLNIKEQQLQHVITIAAGIQTRVTLDRDVWTPGSTSTVKLQLNNTGNNAIHQVRIHPLQPAGGWKFAMKPYRTFLPSKGEMTVSFAMTAPANPESYFHPYHPPVLQVDLSYLIGGQKVTEQITADPLTFTPALLPDWGITLTPEASILNTEATQPEQTIAIKVTNYKNGPSQGTISLDLPKGFKATPAKWNVQFAKADETKNFTVRIQATGPLKAQQYQIPVTAAVGNHKFHAQVERISYPHIGTSYYITDAAIKLNAFPLKLDPSLNIGYVDSGFDDVAEHLRQAGLHVTMLTEDDLKNGDLSVYDTIVVGIRAYLSRDDLLANNQRLLDYVKNGGHVVMQYHKPTDRWKPELAPYPLTPGDPPINWRVTDETAPVTFLKPDHPLLQWPNPITSADFDGWVQERAVYFPSDWDRQHYVPLFSMADPGEKPFDSGLLVADYGKGTYLYTSMVWYREIQNQVPGAYRMFVNMVSYPKGKH